MSWCDISPVQEAGVAFVGCLCLAKLGFHSGDVIVAGRVWYSILRTMCPLWHAGPISSGDVSQVSSLLFLLELKMNNASFSVKFVSKK